MPETAGQILESKAEAVGVRKCPVGQGRDVSHSNPGNRAQPLDITLLCLYVQLYSGRELLSKAEAGENHTLF